MLKKYRHVIWDWNGTLLDDAAVCVGILNSLLAKRGLPAVDLDSYQREFGFPVQGYYEKVGFDFGRESYKDVADEYITAYDRERYGCSLRCGAVEVLGWLRNMGVGSSILSAYHQKGLGEIVEYFGLAGWFEHVFGLDDYCAACKIDLARVMLDKIEYSPDDLLIVGDTIHDFEVAQALGVDCLLTVSGHQSRERLEGCGVTVLDSLLEIPDLPELGGL